MKLNKKASISLDKLVLSVFVFFVFIIGGVLYIHDIETNYAFANVSMGTDTYLNSTFMLATDNDITNDPRASNSSYDFASDSQDRLFGTETVSTGTSEDQQYLGAFAVFRLITSPINMIQNVFNQIAVNIGVPQVFVTYGFIALTTIFIFSAIYLIFRVKA